MALTLSRPIDARAPARADSAPPLVLHARVVAGAGGGPDKTILRSPRYLDPDRVRLAAVYLHPTGDAEAPGLARQARQLGCPLIQIPERGPIDLAALHRLAELCRSRRVAIWHGHDYKSDLLGLMLRTLVNMKLVTTVHGFTRESWRTRLYYHVDNACLPRYHRVLAVSPRLMEHCRRKGVREDRLRYIPNAVETDDYYPVSDADRQRARWRLGVRAERRVVGVVGRLSIEKGVDRAVEVFARVHRDDPRTELHIVGDGPERARLEAHVRELGLAHVVRFFGWRRDAREHYAAFDLLLLPSRTEGLPNVVLEAMACGVPVVAAEVGGVRELLDDGACGRIVNAENPAHWPDVLASLLNRPVHRRRFAEASRRRVVERYSFDARMRKVMAVYDELLGREPATLTESSAATPRRRAA